MIRGRGGLFAVLACLVPSAPVHAEGVPPCTDGRSGARALVEPWVDGKRLFFNGAVRLAVMEIAEPAAASFFLLVLSPPCDGLELRQCALIGPKDGLGFAGLTLDGIAADHDPGTGPRFVLQESGYRPDTAGFVDANLTVAFTQATGDVTGRLD